MAGATEVGCNPPLRVVTVSPETLPHKKKGSVCEPHSCSMARGARTKEDRVASTSREILSLGKENRLSQGKIVPDRFIRFRRDDE